jgi:outer membrane protein TolC
MRKVLNWLISILLWAAPSAVAAENLLTLQDAITISQSQNPEHARIEAELSALAAQTRLAYAPASPVLGLESSGPAALTYTVSQSFGFPGKARTEARTLEFETRKLACGMAALDQETAYSAKSAFYQLWLAGEKLRLDDQKRVAFENILKIAERRSVKETTTEVELLILKTAMESVENERTDDESLKEKAMARLDLLLGRPVDSPLEIQATPAPAYPFSIDLPRLRETLKAENPKLLAEGAEILAAGSRLKSARLSSLPDFTLTGGYITNPAFYTGKLAITIPLYYRFSGREGIKAAGELAAAQAARKLALERRLLTELEDKAAVLKALGLKLDRYNTKIIPLSDRAFRVAMRNYEYGKIDFSTLKASADTWFNSMTEYAGFLADYAAGRAGLELIAGAPLP